MLGYLRRSVNRVASTTHRSHHAAPSTTWRRPLSTEAEKKVVISETGPLYHNEIVVRDHKFVADEPVSNGGQNKGPTPYEYLMGALGSCTTITCRMYAQHKKLPLDKIVVSISHKKLSPEDPEAANGRTSMFTREIDFVGEGLTEDNIKRLLIIADKCPVHHALTNNHSVVVTKLKEK